MSGKSPVLNKIYAKKWLILLILTCVLVVFGRIVDNKSLTQSAIVIGMGIDFSDGEFEVSTQSVSVSESSADGFSQSYVTYSAKGKTINEAVEEIGHKMGLIMSLSHCNVLILSPSALTVDHVSLIMPLTKALALPEQAIVVAAEDVVKALTARIATTVNMPFYTQTVLLQYLGGNGLERVTVKDFLASSLSRSAAVNLPLVEIAEMEEQPLSPSEAPDDNVTLVLEKNLVVFGSDSFVLDAEKAKFAGLFLIKDSKDKLSVQTDGGYVEFRLHDVKKKIKTEGMTVTATLEFSVLFIEAQTNSGGDLDCTSPEIKAAADKLGKEIADGLTSCFTLSVEKNADFLHLQDEVYKKTGRDMPDDCLSQISFTPEVKIVIKGSD